MELLTTGKPHIMAIQVTEILPYKIHKSLPQTLRSGIKFTPMGFEYEKQSKQINHNYFKLVCLGTCTDCARENCDTARSLEAQPETAPVQW